MSSVTMSVTMQKALNAFGAEVIRSCALKYGFDSEEAMREMSVSIALGGKKSKKSEKVGKGAPREVPCCPLPFTGATRSDWCGGVKQNHGLYTQCTGAPGDDGLCKGCAKQASKNASGEPDCGLYAKRVMQGDEYRDPKGRGPVHFTKVMKKQKLTEAQVLSEAQKFGIEVTPEHFVVPETKRGRPKKATTSDTESESSSASGEKKSRGRPKKAAKVVEVNATEDLFASLMQQAQSASPRPAKEQEVEESESDTSSLSDQSAGEETSKSSSKKSKKSDLAQQEKAAEKAAKKQAKELAQQEKAAEKAAEKQKKEAEKQAKAAEKEAEKQAKAAEKEAEKVKKAAEKEAEKAKKLAEKEALAQQKAAKEKKTSKKKAEEPVKPQAKAEEPVADLEPESEEEDTSEAEEPVVTVKKFEHQGVIYLRSSDGVMYDSKTQDVVGKWNEETQSIDVYDDESDEEEDDE
uniref:Uncharacterized protein n=1 Tax=viral metagenome TaxID=1070528 RepID=A0A6C0HCN7_9ZZZZ